MKRANSTDAAKVLEKMPETNLKGVIGDIAFDQKGDMKTASITLYNYTDKKKTVLDVVKM
jgi:branched-chain amino acid transport system substrate-binding protein